MLITSDVIGAISKDSADEVTAATRRALGAIKLDQIVGALEEAINKYGRIYPNGERKIIRAHLRLIDPTSGKQVVFSNGNDELLNTAKRAAERYINEFLKENTGFTRIHLYGLELGYSGERGLFISYLVDPPSPPTYTSRIMAYLGERIFPGLAGLISGVNLGMIGLRPKEISAPALPSPENLKERAVSLISAFNGHFEKLEPELQAAAWPLKSVFERVVKAVEVEAVEKDCLREIFRRMDTFNDYLDAHISLREVTDTGMHGKIVKRCQDMEKGIEMLLKNSVMSELSRYDAKGHVLALQLAGIGKALDLRRSEPL